MSNFSDGGDNEDDDSGFFTSFTLRGFSIIFCHLRVLCLKHVNKME